MAKLRINAEKGIRPRAPSIPDDVLIHIFDQIDVSDKRTLTALTLCSKRFYNLAGGRLYTELRFTFRSGLPEAHARISKMTAYLRSQPKMARSVKQLVVKRVKLNENWREEHVASRPAWYIDVLRSVLFSLITTLPELESIKLESPSGCQSISPRRFELLPRLKSLTLIDNELNDTLFAAPLLETVIIGNAHQLAPESALKHSFYNFSHLELQNCNLDIQRLCPLLDSCKALKTFIGDIGGSEDGYSVADLRRLHTSLFRFKGCLELLDLGCRDINHWFDPTLPFQFSQFEKLRVLKVAATMLDCGGIETEEYYRECPTKLSRGHFPPQIEEIVLKNWSIYQDDALLILIKIAYDKSHHHFPKLKLIGVSHPLYLHCQGHLASILSGCAAETGLALQIPISEVAHIPQSRR